MKKQEEKRERRQNKKADGTGDGSKGDSLSAIPTVQFGLDGLPIEPEPEQGAEGSQDNGDEPKNEQPEKSS